MKQFYIFPCEKLILFLFQVTMRKNANIFSGTEMQNIKSGELWILYIYSAKDSIKRNSTAQND